MSQTIQVEQVEQIESDYFGEEDIMEMHSKLVGNGTIETGNNSKDPLKSPVFFAEVVDHLVNGLIAEITEYPEDMLFGSCTGNYRTDFQRAIDAVKAKRSR